MKRAALESQKLAERLIAHETGSNDAPGGLFPAYAKLRPALAALVGGAGFDALLSRALVLTVPKVPWLRSVKIRADGTVEGPAGLEAKLGPRKLAQGRVALFAQLLGLLRGLIGDNVTMQLMRDVWPGLSLPDGTFRNGDDRENEQ